MKKEIPLRKESGSMAQFGGFISDKLEIKFLILYIAARLIEPVPFARKRTTAGTTTMRR